MNQRTRLSRTVTHVLAGGAALLALAIAPGFASADQPPAQPEASQPHFSPPGGGTLYKRKGETRLVKISAAQSGGRYTVVEGHLAPGARVPAHFHKWHTEMFYVISGEAEWTTNGVTHLMKPGSLLYIPPGTVHSVKVIGNQPFHSLLIDTPAGHEYVIQEQQSQTAEQKKDPEFQKKFRVRTDFYLATPKTK